MARKTARDHLHRRVKELGLYGVSAYLHQMEKALAAVIDHEALLPEALSPPTCFGLRNMMAHDQTCQRCPVQMMCLHRMAHRTMPAVAASIGTFVRQELAQAMGVQEQDVYIAETLALHTGALPRRQANAPVGVKQSKAPIDQWARRFLAERRRYPELRQLPVGTRLYREFDRIRHCVTIEDGHYVVDQERYPTLFCAGAAITGKHPITGGKGRKGQATGHWSVRKLFGQAIKQAAAAARPG